jgi:hypothetical protein
MWLAMIAFLNGDSFPRRTQWFRSIAVFSTAMVVGDIRIYNGKPFVGRNMERLKCGARFLSELPFTQRRFVKVLDS